MFTQQKLQLQQGSILSLPSAQFPDRKFRIAQKLGEGGQGQVYLVQPQGWGNIQQNLALKVQHEMKHTEQEFISNLIQYQSQEDKLPINQRSQIIKIFDLTNYQGFYIILMELGQDDIYSYIQNSRGKLNLLDKIKILKQLYQSIWFMHFNNQIHRDIKPENFVKVGNEFKLIDFGLVKGETKNNYQNHTKNVGSPLFQAPEIKIETSNYSFGVDIWSLGATFYEVLVEDCFSLNNL